MQKAGITGIVECSQPTLNGSPIHAAWIKHARVHPEKVFTS